MQKRSPISVILLTIVTLGIYGIYWQVKTKGEMNALGADIPTALLTYCANSKHLVDVEVQRRSRKSYSW